MRWAMTCLLVAALCQPLYADTAALVTDETITLRNDAVQRVLRKADGVWRTSSISRADGADSLAMQSEGFLIRLMDGTELTLADFRAVGRPLVDRLGRRCSVRVHYAPRGAPPAGAPNSVTVTYSLGDEPYLRKTLTLLMRQGQAVDALQVERFSTELECDRGGRGEPVFIGQAWFAGLEYPGSQTSSQDRLVTLSHFPGLAKRQPATGQWVVESKTAVIGAGMKGDPLELAFSDYVDSIRLPSRNFLQYNSWYDWRGDELTISNLMGTFNGFKDHLLDPYGLKMDAFVPDDGWQNRESIWMPRANLYPEGFAPLRNALEAGGSRMGIWMPINGTNLNADWGAQQGYEKSNRGRFYCLVGPKYNAEIRRATKRVITQGNLAYYKHDFNTLRCTAEGHGHLPDDRHGHEANLDAELELLEYERQLQPGIFLNVTSSVWLSPWWLMHADSIWMCASDFGYDKTYPQLSPREWAMSYRDAHFHNVYARQRKLVPVSAMMTHGIIHGKRLRLGGKEETLRQWSDYVVMYYGRGVQLKELYVSPELLDDSWWQVLGEATRWAVDNHEVLKNVVMVGGSPRAGQAYGYVHWLEDTGIVCLRNPAPFEQAIRVPFDKSVRYRGETGRSFQGRMIYPYVRQMPDEFVSGSPMELPVPACSVIVFECSPGPPPTLAGPLGPVIAASGKAELTPSGTGQVTGSVTVPDEDMPRCDLYLIVRGTGTGVDFDGILVNGAPAKARRSAGEGWVLHAVDLRPFKGSQVTLKATLPGSGDTPFSSPDAEVGAWVVADRPWGSAAVPAEHLPYPISQGFRRKSASLVAPTTLERRKASRRIKAHELEGIKAAKLRIRVFDVNGEPQYRDKHIILNGEKLERVPVNKGRLSAWQESVIDLAPEQLKLIRMKNTLELTNAGGDCYKFTGLTLAVQLADGKWVESSGDWTVRSSVGSWLHAEGKTFRGATSGPIGLALD